MALWKSEDVNMGVPKYTPNYVNLSPIQDNSNLVYGNTQVSAFITNAAVGVFGVDKVEAGITTGEGKKVAHAGWNLRKEGTGPIISISATGTGVDWGSTGHLNITGGGLSNTAANVYYTNTAGVFAFTLNSAGRYVSTPTVSGNVEGSGTGLTFTIRMGGRANRVTYETLVAMGSMTGDGSDDTLFPDS